MKETESNESSSTFDHDDNSALKAVPGSEWEGSSSAYNDPEEKRVLFAALDSF